MHHLERHDADIANLEKLVRMNLIQLNGRHSGIAVFCKAVRQHLKQSLAGIGVGIDVNLSKLTVRTQVVHASHVVIVGMRHQHPVNLPERLWQYLLTEVWSAVNEQAGALRLQQR